MPKRTPGSILSPAARAFLERPRFLSIATLDEDASPRQSVVWYLIEGDELVINSRVGRRWPTNLVREPRIAGSIIDVSDGYRWLGLKGRAEAVEDQPRAQADIAAMAHRYHDAARAQRLIERTFVPQRRISFRITIDEIHDDLEDD